MLTTEIQAEILTMYYTQKCSVREIARALNLNRRTVQRVIDRRSVALAPKVAAKSSLLDPYKEKIKVILEKDPRTPATALLNQLRPDGFMGGITILKDYLQAQRKVLVRPREAFLRLEFSPGEVAQVDWGEFGDVFGDGIKIHCFAMVLAHSRMMYIEFTRSERFEEFIRCHENAFKFFGGTVKECWYDNLTTAVSDRLGSLVRFNSRFMAYMGHHGVRPHACNVAKGNEKGRVEDLIKYIRMNFWPAREFKDFDDLILQSILWRNQVANQREHRAHRRIVRLKFEAEEKPALMALNPVPYDTEEVLSRHVPPEFHLQYETNRYSVPWTLVGLAVTLRVNNLEIKIYYNEKFICSHKRSYLKNKVFTTEAHREGLLARKPGATRESWQLGYVKSLGPKMNDYVELVRQGPRSIKNELSKLIALVTVYGEAMVSSACAECLSAGLVGVDTVELYLKRIHHPSSVALAPAPIKFESEKLNRVHAAVDLRKYDALYFEDKLMRAKEEIEDANGTSTGGLCGAATEGLSDGGQRGSGDDAGARSGDLLKVPAQVDRQGEIRAQNANDPIPNQNGEVPKASDGREL